MPTDLNSLLAKILFVNKLATREQIENNWKYVRPEKNILDLLRDGGFVSPEDAEKVLSVAQKKQIAEEENGNNARNGENATENEQVGSLSCLEATAIFDLDSGSEQVFITENITETAISKLETENVQCLDGLQRYF